MKTEVKNLYSDRAEERRKQFNRLINSCNMVLMNNIPEVDPSVWDNWQDKSPMYTCDIIDGHCEEHDLDVNDNLDQCDYGQDEYPEVYQWFAVGDSDADFLKRHGQYITYSDMLDTYFLAITHFGTSWDYTSMVNDFEDCYTGLENFTDEKEQ